MSTSVHHRYVVVLVLILLSLAFQMAAPDGNGARLVAVTLQAMTLVAAVVTSRTHRWIVRLTVVVCILLVVAAAAAILGSDEFGRDSARLVSLLLVALAPPALVQGMRRHAREEGGTTLNTMYGVLCIYLLIGILFGTMFGVIQSFTDEPFFNSGGPEGTADFLYFSFSTLTTVGFGDLTAAMSLGRSLAVLEALIGQIYLVTVVALIVGGLGPARAGRGA